MKVGELRHLLKEVPDHVDIDFADGNFGGFGHTLETKHISLDGKGRETRVLIEPPYWRSVEEDE